jgi:hypothetical protein
MPRSTFAGPTSPVCTVAGRQGGKWHVSRPMESALASIDSPHTIILPDWWPLGQLGIAVKQHELVQAELLRSLDVGTPRQAEAAQPRQEAGLTHHRGNNNAMPGTHRRRTRRSGPLSESAKSRFTSPSSGTLPVTTSTWRREPSNATSDGSKIPSRRSAGRTRQFSCQGGIRCGSCRSVHVPQLTPTLDLEAGPAQECLPGLAS